MALHVGSVLVPGELARETRVIRLSSGLSKAMGNKLSRSFWESRVPAFLPDNGHAVRCNSVGFLCSVWDNGCLITSGRSGRNLGGATSRLANSRKPGPPGPPGGYQHYRRPVLPYLAEDTRNEGYRGERKPPNVSPMKGKCVHSPRSRIPRSGAV